MRSCPLQDSNLQPAKSANFSSRRPSREAISFEARGHIERLPGGLIKPVGVRDGKLIG
jgi:hypothetical protein